MPRGWSRGPFCLSMAMLSREDGMHTAGCMLDFFALLSTGNAATYPENQEWPFAAFSCELLTMQHMCLQ
jgi:hypothetical protein